MLFADRGKKYNLIYEPISYPENLDKQVKLALPH